MNIVLCVTPHYAQQFGGLEECIRDAFMDEKTRRVFYGFAVLVIGNILSDYVVTFLNNSLRLCQPACVNFRRIFIGMLDLLLTFLILLAVCISMRIDTAWSLVGYFVWSVGLAVKIWRIRKEDEEANKAD